MDNVKTVRQLAIEGGYLPESLPGDRMRPRLHNKTTWQLKAAMLRYKWTLETEVDEQTFHNAIDVVGGIAAR